MSNFSIKNKSEEVTEIDVFGAIGEDWFGEGNTMENVRAKLMDVRTPNIHLNLSSFGGSVNDALVIYNLLKVHPAKVTTNYMGFNASASTIIGSAGDVIKMDKSGSFLVHNAWNMVVGNQHDLREEADFLEQIDNNIVKNIYKPLTGKRTDSLLNLMKEEKWIDAEEAKTWGFVHETYEPTKAAASIHRESIKQINNSRLPKINNDMADKLEEAKNSIVKEVLNGVKAFFETEKKEVSDEVLNAKVTEEVENKMKEIQTSVDEKVKEVNNKVTELETAKNTLEDTVKAKDEEIKNLQHDLSKYKATATATEAPITEENVDGVEAELNEGQKIIKGLFANMSESEKALAKLYKKENGEG